MKINADLTQRAVVETGAVDWVASPAQGVDRKMLDRDGEEVARATSLVRYAPKSSFPPHQHDDGEEFLVLEGVFLDETGSYPAGTYVRNPPGTSHAPFTDEGCVILVKLRQMGESDTEQIVVDTRSGEWVERGNGLSALPLYSNAQTGEVVYMVKFVPGATVAHDDHPAGEELFVVEGDLADEYGRYGPGTWVRAPAGSSHAPWSEGGCTLWVKKGHLPVGP